MKKITIFIFLLLFASISFAQVSGNNDYTNKLYGTKPDRNVQSNSTISNNEEITLQVNGLKNIIADNYVVMFSVMQVGETAEITNQLMNSRIDSFAKELQSVNVSASDVSVDMISFVPKYNFAVEDKIFSKTYNEVPAGFVMQKSVTIKYKHSFELDKIITAASKFEIYDLVKVDYFAENLNKQIDSLRNLCLVELKSKIKSYETLGFKLDTMQKIFNEDFKVIYPETRYYSYSAFSRPSLDAANKKSKVDVNEANKFPSSYYNQVEYDDYDIVVNPVVTEPVIQISYSATIKYFLIRKPVTNKYFIFPADGTVKQFNP